MLIINADDYGRNQMATDRIITCFKKAKITSTSAMVFMNDSQRASEQALEYGINVGLHLNFTEKLTQGIDNLKLSDYHDSILRYLTRNKYNYLFYNPLLKNQFEYVFKFQFEEFQRLYGRAPAHINGHHHMHLCSNMLIGKIIPEGNKVRRNFSYTTSEKSLPNILFRRLIDSLLARKYLITNYLFSIPELIRHNRLLYALNLANYLTVEFETHPEVEEDFNWLLDKNNDWIFLNHHTGTYTDL